MELTQRFPSRVNRLVLVRTAPGTPGAVPHPAVFAMMLSPLRYYNRRAAEVIIPLIAGGKTAADQYQLRLGLHDRLKHPPRMRGYAYQLMAISTFTSWPWLHRIPHRTLIVHGPRDGGYNCERHDARLDVAAAVCRGSATSDGLRDEQPSRRITGCEVLSENL